MQSVEQWTHNAQAAEAALANIDLGETGGAGEPNLEQSESSGHQDRNSSDA